MKPAIELRFGRWEKALSDVAEVDALIVDAPYSARTHNGHNGGVASANRVRPEDEKRMRLDRRTGAIYAVGAHRRQPFSYEAWSRADVRAFVQAWHPRTRGWFVAMADHLLAPAWAAALSEVGRYVFSPLAFVAPGSRVRLVGDGPAQWAVWIIVARPRSPTYAKWGALPGAYVLPPGQRTPRGLGMVGVKPEWLMRRLIADYSRPGELVCDPCAGSGTTLLAAALEGRRAIGAESVRAHYQCAKNRLSSLFAFDDADDEPAAVETSA